MISGSIVLTGTKSHGLEGLINLNSAFVYQRIVNQMHHILGVHWDDLWAGEPLVLYNRGHVCVSLVDDIVYLGSLFR